ncbi:MAG: glycoside hydrolase family 2 [Oscillospiraceae bacterium]|nr:glycoside hydrolase family 2 [Oscillospiraceae bacterium]
MSVMLTNWGKDLDREAPLPEYPRPQLKRDSYVNLNGLWDYAFTESEAKPARWDGQIVVPFSPEAPLSGVNRRLKKTETLHYRRSFTLPEGFRLDRVILHFGAVDQIAKIYVNNIMVTEHRGGYWPFSADITPALRSGENELRVSVRDDADDDALAYGKQRYKSGGIWYTAQSGIWQTVWMESVPTVYIKSIKITPEYDQSRVRIKVAASADTACTVDVLDAEGAFVAGSWTKNGECVIPLPGFHPWSPEDPYLYSLRLELGKDRAESYFAMRKFSYTTHNGHRVFALNDKPCFHNGLLDQGYWPDGLLTPPADEAMIFDIQTAKSCGFNMLRKHIKIEPLRWYYHCDRLGMLVWQDMVSGGQPYDPVRTSWLPLIGTVKLPDRDARPFGRRTEESKKQYYTELRDTVALLYNCPCIALWTPFNEGWGQFDALKAAGTLRELDDTRFIDHASGWQDQGWEEIQSRHIYFRPVRLKNDGRALCLTEFGGYTLAVEGHRWCDRVFGYKICRDAAALERDYRKLFRRQIVPHVQKEGLTAAVYTQLTDVEQEMNGLLTYDRAVLKIGADALREIHEPLKFT